MTSPAPVERRGMRLSQMLTLADQTDSAGRLLLEDSAPVPAVRQAERAGIAMTTSVCEYPDTPSRRGGLMNTSAYDALRADTAPVLRGFAWLSSRFLEQRPRRRDTVESLLHVSNLGVTLPLVLFFRTRNPVAPHGVLPPFIASLFKASRGVFSAAVDMVNRKGGAHLTTAEEVLAFAEEHGHLARPATGRVCAAPSKLIGTNIAAMLAGDPAEAARSDMGELVDFDELWEFYTTQETFSQAVSQYRHTLDRLLSAGQGPVRVTHDPGADLRRSIRQLAGLVVTEGGRTGTFGQLTEAMIIHANTVQASLNRALGREELARPLSFDDLARLL